jgi:hypothetical protein
MSTLTLFLPPYQINYNYSFHVLWWMWFVLSLFFENSCRCTKCLHHSAQWYVFTIECYYTLASGLWCHRLGEFQQCEPMVEWDWPIW